MCYSCVFLCKFAYHIHVMRVLLSFLFSLLLTSAFAQVPDEEELSHPVVLPEQDPDYREFAFEQKDGDTLIKSNDLYYREDQFYFGLTYNLLQNRTHGISQNSFSMGINMGFLRDFPLNQRRNVALAIGAGYSFSNYRTNLFIANADKDRIYQIAQDFDKSKLWLHYIEVPLELRWRTSTPKNTQFWRIYTGFKVSYMTFNRSQITGNFPTQTVRNNPDFQDFLYSVYLSVGHGTLNFYVSYTLNPLLDKAYIEGSQIRLTSLNVGLMFYIL